MAMEKTEEAGKRASQLVADYLASRYHTLRIIKESGGEAAFKAYLGKEDVAWA